MSVLARRRRFGLSRGALLAGTSFATLLFSVTQVHARALNGGGSGAVSAPNFASDAAALAAQQAASTARQTQQSLARAAKAVQDMQAVQSAARAAAAARQTSVVAPVAVPNGLGGGGLLPNDPTKWTNAATPTQSVDSAGQTQVGIRQSAQKAVLDWRQFNVGARTTLTFDQQGNRDWVALNRVDASTGPSQILGEIKADGQVYVINQSGIIFGGASQINVGSLIASTAKMVDPGKIYSAQVSNDYVPSFSGAGEGGIGNIAGKIFVEQGAQIATHAPTSVTAGGGYVMLLGSDVSNAGTISAPKGQIALASGHDFIIRTGLSTDANTFSTTRGSEIVAGTWSGTAGTAGTWTVGGGTVANSGIAFAQQGDITLTGRTIMQDGVLLSTTTVNQRGTIHLLNAAGDTKGSVTLTGSSVATILPELDSTETALDSQRDGLIAASDAVNLLRAQATFGRFDNLSLLADRQDQSRIEIVSGGAVIFKGGSYTAAQGGQIAVSAKNRITTETDATLDVSGLRGVALAMESNNLSVNIQGFELRDSPVNREGSLLKNENVWVDIRSLTLVPKGTGGYDTDRYYTSGGLLEVGGYLANTKHTIGEWSALGGTITLSANEVVVQKGATLDISGGSLDYAGGWIRSTNLIGSDGRRYSVDNAPGDLEFANFAGGFRRSHNIQGQEDKRLVEIWTSVFDRGRTSMRWEGGYTVGRDAGSLILLASSSIAATVEFSGDIIADVILGQRQIKGRLSSVSDGYKVTQTTVPHAARLDVLGSAISGTTVPTAVASDVVFSSDAANAANGKMWFDSEALNLAALGGLLVQSQKAITVVDDIVFAPGANIGLYGGGLVRIAGDITARGGSVSLGQTTATAVRNTGGVSVDGGVTIDTRGLWTNLLLDPATTWRRAYINGGTVTLRSYGDVTLEAGSLIDASAGGAVLQNLKSEGGDGGDISIVASSTVALGTGKHGKLTLDGALVSYGFGKGGKLTLETGGTIAIGGVDDGVALTLPVSLFQAGFSSYSLNGQGGFVVGNGVSIEAVMPVWRFASAAYALPTDDNAADAAELWLPPLYLENPAKETLTRRAGVNVSLLSGVGADGSSISSSPAGSLTIGKGASVTVDPGSSVRLASSGQITIDGIVTAPGGSITIVNTYAEMGAIDPGALSIWVGADAVLDAAARAYIAYGSRGHAYGVVPDGGTITLGSTGGEYLNAAVDNAPAGIENSTHAFIVIRPGAVLDASGASGALDILEGNAWRRVNVTSDGGAIALRSYSGIHAEGTLRALAGGAGASGGALTVNLESLLLPSLGTIPSFLKAGRVLTVARDVDPGALATDAQAGSTDSHLAIGRGAITVRQIEEGGFDSVSLLARSAIVFDGDVTLGLGRSLSLKTGQIADLSVGTVRLSSPYVRLDGWNGYALFNQTLPNTVPAYAPVGTLSIRGDLIEVVNSVSTTFAGTNIYSSGDLRFLPGWKGASPYLTAARDLDLTAARIYPASNVTATLQAGYAANNYTVTGGSVVGWAKTDLTAELTLSRPDDAPVAAPYSAFGNLIFNAGSIRQGGALFAPFGAIRLNASTSISNDANAAQAVVELLPGSITSVSGAGLIVPYGGTADGVNWTVNGATVNSVNLVTGQSMTSTGAVSGFSNGILIQGTSIVAEADASVNLSGGGTLGGAGFVSGRGGSVDTLLYPLIASNPANTYSVRGNKVYAIIPGVVTAPVAGGSNVAWTGSVPGIGEQITIPANATGLPAGLKAGETYTLLPANYALLPGAFRIEIGAASTMALAAAAVLGNGSYVLSAYQGVASTAIRDALPTQVIVTPGAAVRSYAQYDETNYAAFQISQAATLGNIRPQLEADGKTLAFVLSQLNAGAAGFGGPTLSWAEGVSNLTPAAGGYGGTVSVMTGQGVTDLILTADGSATERTASSQAVVPASVLNAIGAPTLYIGGMPQISNNISVIFTGQSYTNSQTRSVLLESGAVLTGGQVFVGATQGGSIRLDPGARIDTRDFADIPLLDSTSASYFFGGGLPFIAASNGTIELYAQNASNAVGTISVGAGAGIYTRSTIAFFSKDGVSFDGAPLLGAKTLDISAGSVNLGASAADLAAAPAGLRLTQALFSSLIAGDPANGVAGVRNLKLGTSSSVNIYGSVAIDLSSLDSLVLTAPAIYGAGRANDIATLKLAGFVWNVGQRTVSTDGDGRQNYGSVLPGATIPGGPGNGAGALTIDARTITVGHAPYLAGGSTTTFDHLLLGFSGVTLSASERIVTEGKATLSAWQTGSDPSAAFDAATYAGVGGSLTLLTPLLTTDAGGVASLRTGGALSVVLPAGAVAANTAEVSALGGQIDFVAGKGIRLDTAIALPSGRLTATAKNNIQVERNARIDLSGRAVQFFDVTKYSWGGDVVLESGAGGQTFLFDGATLDVSAVNNSAGSITLSDSSGVVFVDNRGRNLTSFDGMFKGSATQGYNSGSFTMKSKHFVGLDLDTGFASLNRALDAGGFFETRDFTFKEGSLVINDRLTARNVQVSVDNGSLTVNGTIDASGEKPGSISLAARDDLTLASTAVLDVHGSVLQVDSYGKPIEATNRGHIELTSAKGWLRLNKDARINLSSPDGVSRGNVVLNASRTAETSGDIRIEARERVIISGAASVTVNGFWTYSPTDADGTIVQNNGSTTPVGTDGSVGLDQIHTRSYQFVSNALENDDLKMRLAGLPGLEIRPGVEIVSKSSANNLTVKGDLDLSKFRYGPNADTDPASPTYGRGTAGSFVLRAGNNLSVQGSINDGFKASDAASNASWSIFSGSLGVGVTTNISVTLPAGTTIPNRSGLTLSFALPIQAASFSYGAILPFSVPVAAGFAVPAGTTLLAPIYADAAGTVILRDADGAPYAKGYTFSTATTLFSDAWLGKGSQIYTSITAKPMTVPAGTDMSVFSGAVTVSTNLTLLAGTKVPAGINVAAANVLTSNLTLPSALTLTTAASFPNANVTLSFAVPLATSSAARNLIKTGVAVPFAFTSLDAFVVPAAGSWISTATAAITVTLPNGATQSVAPGTPVPAGAKIPANTAFAAGTILPGSGGNLRISGTVPAGVSLGIFDSRIFPSASIAVAAGAVLPAGTNIQGAIGTVASNFTLPMAATLSTSTTFPVTATLNFPFTVTAGQIKRGVAVPFAFTGNAALSLANGTNWKLTGTLTLGAALVVTDGKAVMLPDGTSYSSGASIPVNTVLPVGTIITNATATTLGIPAASVYGTGTTLPGAGALGITATVPANTALSVFNAAVALGAPLSLAAGTILPSGTNIQTLVAIPLDTAAHQNFATAQMLAPGTDSWSLRLVAGADVSAASSRSLLAVSQLDGRGHLTFSDYHVDATSRVPIFSVVRTGTGSLDLLAGGNVAIKSLYGIYTAGTNTGATGLVAGTYMPDHGGDLKLVSQGDVTGYSFANSGGIVFGSPVNWLARDGGDTANASWSIRFGANAVAGSSAYVAGFTGIGTLGGGNLTLIAGGNVGTTTRTYVGSASSQTYEALQVAVGATGQVTEVFRDGSIVTGGRLNEAGGGDLTVKIGGGLNFGNNYLNAAQSADGSVSVFTNLRGDISIEASSIGAIREIYGQRENADPRALEKTAAVAGNPQGGIALVPGDGVTTVRTTGDLVLATIADAGQIVNTALSASAFSLWQPRTTAVELFTAGGNLVPVTGSGLGAGLWTSKQGVSLTMAPSQTSAVAASGSLYLGGNTFVLAPSADGHLELLAAESIYGASLAIGAGSVPGSSLRIDISGAGAGVNDIPNPFRPVSGFSGTTYYNFASFQDDTATGNLHAADSDPIRIYAANGDIVNLAFGEKSSLTSALGGRTVYLAAKPAWIKAARDIVNLGAGSATGTTSAVSGLILNNGVSDVSVIEAGRDIWYANMQIAGPGSLDVFAGRNLYQGDKGRIVSIGRLGAQSGSGASILMQAGTGASGPNYAGLLSYLDPRNLAVVGTPLLDQPGKVAKTYEKELATWLNERYGFVASSDADARTYFSGLASEQQAIFLRTVYFAELRESGREYTGKNESARLGSYLRGRQVIAALFPDTDHSGNPLIYTGDITMFSTAVSGSPGSSTYKTNDGTVWSQAGGDIQFMVPGGQIVVGVEGVVPGANAGVLTQFGGDIAMYSQGSLKLGLSRIMTNYGDDILVWSNKGDINAGRGAKTTIGYTAPRRVYDELGNVTLVPSVPQAGAGIAARSAIAGVDDGDIDLNAPEGVIDVGEAGISGRNINLAATAIINAANVTTSGNVTGVPMVQAPNIATALSTSNATAATQQVATPNQGSGNERPSVIIVEVLGYGGGDDQQPEKKRKSDDRQTYNTNSVLQVVGSGVLSNTQKQALTADEQIGLQER